MTPPHLLTLLPPPNHHRFLVHPEILLLQVITLLLQLLHLPSQVLILRLQGAVRLKVLLGALGLLQKKSICNLDPSLLLAEVGDFLLQFFDDFFMLNLDIRFRSTYFLFEFAYLLGERNLFPGLQFLYIFGYFPLNVNVQLLYHIFLLPLTHFQFFSQTLLP